MLDILKNQKECEYDPEANPEFLLYLAKAKEILAYYSNSIINH